ncbi:MAG: low-specificity L-threonine aldolase [Nitrospira sp. SB0677_bin_15]|nr:low-specificity L-threonine aldolase [Nitrospira sp. SB0667_bin_9]MYD31734.1 low-specificity L-threonine aldolase [Nitrospira sp. SB0661_bin_20]MYG40603.1 low-specificity L-threonine aldolase [Nitrospira sp. SB0677_bin_15]MYJ23387.1 low-specificity L-threonine aldolase [Nitrospira sp. SB0673_bin_12]
MIDLRSDTVTKPTPGMRAAMAQAEVGDDVYGEDPTVNALEAKAACVLGKDAALFVPTGVMANQLCLRLHTRPGDEVLVEGTAHIIRYEGGAASALSQVQLCCIDGDRGLLTADSVLAAIRPQDVHNPPTTLLCLEQTHNFGGGSVYPLSVIREITKLAGDQGLALHLDGARLFNASVATGVSVVEFAQPFDTVSFCLSKGLGAPVGSLITSTKDRIAKLRRLRKMFGGGMRQAGILAAAGLYALEHHVTRLQEDHENAKSFALQLQQIPTVYVEPDHVETNIVVFEVVRSDRSTQELLHAFREAGVLLNAIGDHLFRAVTHLDVSNADVEQATHKISSVLAEA